MKTSSHPAAPMIRPRHGGLVGVALRTILVMACWTPLMVAVLAMFELSFMAKPLTLREAIFKLQTKGYKPILAHAERYLYFHKNVDELIELKDTGLFFQLNILSLSGYYSKGVKQMAEKLVDKKVIDFIGSDCHNGNQLISLSQVLNGAEMNKLRELNLLNDSL